MKKLFFTLCAAVISMAAMAQDNLVVTLSHEDNISSYYGVDAFTEAYGEAVDGDIITLSAGEFNNPTTIDKALTIRGTGMKTSDETGDVTELKSFVTINIPENSPYTLQLEGLDLGGTLYIYGKNSSAVAYIKKCSYIGSLEFKGGTYYCKDLLCLAEYSSGIVIKENTVNNSAVYTNVVIQNSEIMNISVSNYNHAYIENCVYKDGSGLSNSTIRNSIFCKWHGSGTYVNASCEVSYCIDGTASNIFRDLGTNSTNNVTLEGSVNPYNSLFEQYDGKYKWHLTSTAAAQYLGNDGTQVGIYGGAHPFDPTITAPKVRKMVLNQQVSNGKLGVTIEVE